MKQFICILLILLVLTGCTTINYNSEYSSIPEKIINSSESFSSIAEEDTIADDMQIDYDADNRENILEYYIENHKLESLEKYDSKESELVKKHSLDTNWNSFVNNEDSIKDLIDNQKISKEDSWKIIQDLAWRTLINGAGEAAISVYYPLAVFNKEISFVRVTGEIDDKCMEDYYGSGKGLKAYTVFESDLGGYFYIFFYYFPEIENYIGAKATVLRAVLFLPSENTPSKSDFDNCKNLDDVINISPISIPVKSFAFKRSIHLLKDGVIYFIYDNTTEEIVYTYYSEDYIIPDQFDDMRDTYGYEGNEDWIDYDLRVLPGDYLSD